MKVKYIRGGKLKLKGSALKVSLLNEIIQNTKHTRYGTSSQRFTKKR